MMTHADLIDRLGGPAALRHKLADAAKLAISLQAVWNWKSGGVPWKWRPHVGMLAREAGIPLPAGFLPEELLQSIPESQDKTPRRAGEAA